MSDYLPLLKSKHNSMALLLAHPEFYPEEAEWRGRYVWLLRSSLEALGEPLTPQGSRRKRTCGHTGTKKHCVYRAWRRKQDDE
jgi:hypothetical protein